MFIRGTQIRSGRVLALDYRCLVGRLFQGQGVWQMEEFWLLHASKIHRSFAACNHCPALSLPQTFVAVPSRGQQTCAGAALAMRRWAASCVSPQDHDRCGRGRAGVGMGAWQETRYQTQQHMSHRTSSTGRSASGRAIGNFEQVCHDSRVSWGRRRRREHHPRQNQPTRWMAARPAHPPVDALCRPRVNQPTNHQGCLQSRKESHQIDRRRKKRFAGKLHFSNPYYNALLIDTATIHVLREQDGPPHGWDSPLLVSFFHRDEFCPGGLQGVDVGPCLLPHDAVVAPEVAQDAADGAGRAVFEGCQRPAGVLLAVTSSCLIVDNGRGRASLTRSALAWHWRQPQIG